MLHQHRRRTGWRCYGGLYSKGGGKSPPQTPSRRAYRRRTETSKGKCKGEIKDVSEGNTGEPTGAGRAEEKQEDT